MGSIGGRFITVLKRARARRYPWNRIAGRLATPKRGQQFSRSVDVTGWTLSLDGAAMQVHVDVGGKTFASLQPDKPSPYLVPLYPELAGSRRAAFHVSIPAAVLGRRARISVRAEALPDAQRRQCQSFSLGAVRVLRSETAAPHQRGSYRVEWDRAAASLPDAQIAVCGTYDSTEYGESGMATAHAIREWCRVGPSDVVLEIGCGTGRVGAKLAPFCAKWIGTDISAAMLAHAQRSLAGLSNVELRLLSGVDLAVMDSQSADVVYCTGVFMHLDEWDRYRYVDEAFRVLRDGGRVYVDSMNLLGEQGWALFLQIAESDPLNRPARVSKASTPEELRHYVTKVGFIDVQVIPADLWITVVATKPRAAPDSPPPFSRPE